MFIPEYYYLSEAAKELGRSESFLIRLGIAGKLKFYIRPKNWAHRKDNAPLTAFIINEPILIDDLVYLRKLDNGVDCVMYFSGQYPDSYLENLDAAELEATNDGCEEFSNPQLGVQITKDRLMLRAEDLALFMPKQNALPEQQVEAASVMQTDEPRPWLVANPNDPEPAHDWYISARYFARQLVNDDSTLLTKRPLVAKKVVQSLNYVGIKKRGGKKSFAEGTILKALANIDFS